MDAACRFRAPSTSGMLAVVQLISARPTMILKSRSLSTLRLMTSILLSPQSGSNRPGDPGFAPAIMSLLGTFLAECFHEIAWPRVLHNEVYVKQIALAQESESRSYVKKMGLQSLRKCQRRSKSRPLGRRKSRPVGRERLGACGPQLAGTVQGALAVRPIW